MNILISDGNDRFACVLECPEEICKDFYTYLGNFIDSDEHGHTWGAEELVRYMNKTRPPHLREVRIIHPYTDQYDECWPRFHI